MQKEKNKYSDVTGILRRSRPVLKDPGEIENNVMRIIHNFDREKSGLNGMLDTLFGWVYVGWIRRSLVTASVLLAGLFIIQQGVILRKISSLEQQAAYIPTAFTATSNAKYSGSLAGRLAGLKSLRNTKKITDKEIERIIDSYNDLEIKYKDILRTIDEDPDLRKYFNEKLPGFDKEKIKL